MGGGIRRLGSLGDPVIGTRHVDVHAYFLPNGIVVAQNFNKTTVSPRRRLGNDNSVRRVILGSVTL
jgi:hypothetical protein